VDLQLCGQEEVRDEENASDQAGAQGEDRETGAPLPIWNAQPPREESSSENEAGNDERGVELRALPIAKPTPAPVEETHVEREDREGETEKGNEAPRRALERPQCFIGKGGWRYRDVRHVR
jgi:hypothetical protein